MGTSEVYRPPRGTYTVKMLRASLLLCLVGLAFAQFDSSLDSYWETFKRRHNKQYEETVEKIRRVIWEKNLALIRQHNLEADLGMHTYTLGINEYADWSNEEFKDFLTGYRPSNSSVKGAHFIAPSNVQVPDEVDWRKEGYVTPVKNQLQCGSCWAFSTTGSLEGQTFEKTGKLVSLSEQNLVDCSKAEGNHGCEGGLMDFGFEYIYKNDGIDTETSYPYEAKDDVCRFRSSDVGATDVGYVDIRHYDESALMQAVATVGPISVAIDAGHPSFQSYRTGVYYEPRCSSTRLDHGVLAVGYGTYQGEDYWLVKNSWGESWGMDGYIMMARNRNNHCGIATQASYPL